MHSLLAMSFRHYMSSYRRYAIEFWVNMGPAEYTTILVIVFVSGYLMMKSAR
jgi:hypothetical protein